MLFVGDIASPNLKTTDQLKASFRGLIPNSAGQTWIGNFEGLINDQEDLLLKPSPILFNHPKVVEVLKDIGFKAVGLANNHTLDIAENFDQTIKSLSSSQIAFGGAGSTPKKAIEPVLITDKENTIALIFCCWDFLLYHQKNPTNGIHIAETKELEIIELVKNHKATHPDHKIIVFPHWSFDLETLPFPMYREWSKKLIDLGVSGVVGCHSHCVQGGEKYKEGFIVYGLGNFFIPNRIFANGRLAFPALSKKELVLEWDSTKNNIKCHWIEYEYENDKHLLKYIESEEGFDQNVMRSYSPFQGMSSSEYLNYFKKNRRKKKGIPIYSNFNKTRSNAAKTKFLKLRAQIARSLANANLIKWQN